MQIKVIYPEIGWRPHQILFVYIHYDNVWLIKIYFKLQCKCHFDKTEVVSEFFYFYFSCYLHFTMFWCISCFGERFQSSIRANMYKTKTVGAFIVLPLVSTFNTPFVQLDDNGTNCTCSNKPWTFFLHTNAIDFTNVTNGSPMETLVILITVLYQHVIQQTSFYSLNKTTTCLS